jgi:adiponectin receptor
VDESKHLLESIEDSAVIHYIEELNHKLVNLTDKVADLFDSNDMEWIDAYGNEQDKTNKLHRWPLFVMLVSAIICLGCSTIFHWFSAHSKDLHEVLNRLDYAGISILIAGSCYPPYYYFFFCTPLLRNAYLTFISTFAITVFIYSFRPDFNKPHKRQLRGIMFLTLGLSTAFPILHLAFFP